MTDRMNRTELHYAAVDGKHEDVVRLLAEGLDPNAVDDRGFTPLHFAAQDYYPEIAKTLIDAGAGVDPVNVNGATPLSVAVMNSRGRGDVIRLLLAAGADPDKPDRVGLSPRATAEMIANFDIKQFFEEA